MEFSDTSQENPLPNYRLNTQHMSTVETDTERKISRYGRVIKPKVKFALQTVWLNFERCTCYCAFQCVYLIENFISNYDENVVDWREVLKVIKT